MDPPPPAPPLSTSTAATPPPPPNTNYPDSVDSSPRSRTTDSWDDHPQPFPSLSSKLRLMCSYGGHIVPRPHDKSLCYVGGDTRIVVVDRQSTTLSDLTTRLSKTLLNKPFTLKYQLPNEDLDSLISLTTDEDLDNMIEEYDRLINNNSSHKPSRIRLFLFESKPESGSSIGSLLDNSAKSEDWFLNALNGATGGFSESASVNNLLGLDDDVSIVTSGTEKEVVVKAHDVHSVPDSPMLDTTSSFGSASSSPLLANLPPIKVHVAEDQQKSGIEEQFAQISVGSVVQKQEDGGFLVLSSAAAAAAVGGSQGLSGEYPNRVLSDEERSELGMMPIGYRKLPQTQTQQVSQQLQSKPTGGGVDLASPDSVSSDNSSTNPLSRQRAVLYQEQNPSGSNRVPPVYSVDPNFSDQNSRVQMQQVQDPVYVLSTQFDQQNQQLNPQQQQQQPQYIQAGTHFIHHQPTGAVPVASYYPMYPPQQQPLHPQHLLDQQYPAVYYMPVRQAQAYNMPVQQSNYSETAPTVPSNRPQTPPLPSAAYNNARNAPAPKPEMATGMYRTANVAAPHLVQVPSSQHQPQYVAFSQIHHPSQSIAPTSAATASYAYEFADPAHASMYYGQPLAPQLAAQYQTMTSAPAPAPSLVSPEASAQIPTDNTKQQVRTSQP